jgi:hypothetical protein
MVKLPEHCSESGRHSQSDVMRLKGGLYRSRKYTPEKVDMQCEVDTVVNSVLVNDEHDQLRSLQCAFCKYSAFLLFFRYSEGCNEIERLGYIELLKLIRYQIFKRSRFHVAVLS